MDPRTIDAEIFLRHVPGLEEALRHGGETHNVYDVVQEIMHGQAQLWGDEHALIVTQIEDAPQRRVLHFWLATGDMDPLVQLSRRVIEWGKRNGCTAATITGRKGWERALAAEGWRPSAVLLEREV